MKIRVTFKCPDYWAQNEEGEQVVVPEDLKSKFFEYDEYVEIELDTVKKTARVVEQ